jgi:RES domain-containing protein
VDLTGDRYQQVGLTASDLVADDFAACQGVGGAVAWMGYDGLLVPSARADGGNIVILVDSLAADSVFDRIAETEVDV